MVHAHGISEKWMTILTTWRCNQHNKIYIAAKTMYPEVLVNTEKQHDGAVEKKQLQDR